MTQNEIVEQAKQGNVKAIAALMNRLLKSQGMLATLERTGDRLDILIESDLRSPDDEIRIPKRPILVGMLRKWFITLEIQSISTVAIAWQKTGFDEPVWTEEIRLGESDLEDSDDITEGTVRSPQKMPLPPLPNFAAKSNIQANSQEAIAPKANTPKQNAATASPDLDEMFGGGFGDNTAGSIMPNFADSDSNNGDFDFDDITDITMGETSPTTKSRSTAQGRNTGEDILLLSDIPPIPNSSFNDSGLSESPNPEFNSGMNLPPRNIFTTSNFQWQFLQYLAACAVIIISLNLIHRVLGSTPNPKSTEPAPTSSVIPLGDYFV